MRNIEIDIDFENMNEERKFEFFQLAVYSIRDSIELGESEAIICEIEGEDDDETIQSDVDHEDDSYYLFLDRNQWNTFLEEAKDFFISLQEYEICGEITEIQKSIIIPNIIESLIKIKN